MTDRTVLVTDDNKIIRMLVTSALRPLGCRVLEAENGREALDLIDAEHPDLVLLDVVMPEMDGFTVLETLAARPDGFPCPVVMLTTAGQEEDVARAKLSGAADHMLKPFENAELRNTVAGLLGMHP